MSVVLVGLGPIGVEVARALHTHGAAFAAAADPVHSGVNLLELFGESGDSPAVVTTIAEALAAARAGDIAVLCTGSRLPQVVAQIEEIVAAGLHVVSTCEELSFPRLRHPGLAAQIDALARQHGVGVVGTGVNPGLVMDRLPLVAAAACTRVLHVSVERVVDAARRRGPLRAKVGAGLTVEEFDAGVAAGRLGHVGLAESAALLANGLGFPIDEIGESIEPVVADGVVQGVKQAARVICAGMERVRLDLTMAVGAFDPHDRVVIQGDPPVDLRVNGGFQGDRATVGTVLHAIDRIARAGAGLHTVRSLPL